MNDLSEQHGGQNNHPLVEEAQRQFERQLVRYARVFVAREDLALESVQETFLQLCQLPVMPSESLLGPWLFRVCRNRAIDIQRKEKRMKTGSQSLLNSALGEGSDPEVLASKQETISHLKELLTGLTENQQEVVRLKFQNGFSYREIADVTGLSTSNVGVQLHEAIQKIRSRMNSFQ